MTNTETDLLCFSHLRWNFVFQRPQHLLSRFAKTRRVFFWEEPVFVHGKAHIQTALCEHTGVRVFTPALPHGLTHAQAMDVQAALLQQTCAEFRIEHFIGWFYTPMAIEFTRSLKPAVTVYDCMDELSHFAGAPPEMLANESELFSQANLVFTGGASLYAAKKNQHQAVFLFPSSIDVAHFESARQKLAQPEDQQQIGYPRFGYAGVIDERMDLELVAAVADARPDWQFVFLGPIVKIDPASLPRRANIHFLGMKSYADLPAYFSGWQIGMLPFALNDATRFISPTKTPEYLAAGLRVISTPIRDVVSPYGEQGFVAIAKDADEFVARSEEMLADDNGNGFQQRVDRFLSSSSWDKTWREMARQIDEVLAKRRTDFRPQAVNAFGKDAIRV